MNCKQLSQMRQMIKYKLKQQVKRAVHLNHFVKEVRCFLGKGLTKKEVMKEDICEILRILQPYHSC